MVFNKLTIIFFSLTVCITTQGQSIDHYAFSLTGMYLPGGGGRSEIYSKSKNKLEHIASESYHGKHHKSSRKKKRLKNQTQIENTITQLDSLFHLTEFKFTIKKSIIDSIKEQNNWNRYDQLSNDEIEHFFSHGDTVALNLKDIKPEVFEGTVIDGYPYWFDLKIKRPHQDSIEYKFEGNFRDGVQTSNIKNWLPVYLAYRQSSFFNTMPMEAYFTDKNLVNVLIRFIQWTK